MNVLAVVAMVSYALLSPTGGQVQPTPKPDVVKPAVRKPATTKPSRPIESGPCHIGVIPVGGDLFVVEKFGPLTFLDRRTRVSIAAWALNDLVVSRVRAAAPGSSVRGIPYTIEELRFGGREKQRPLFYNAATDIGNFVRFLAPKLRCERYVVVHRNPGIKRESGIGISQYPYNGPVTLFAMMYIRVYDGATFEMVKEAPALMTENTYMERLLHNPLGGPSRELDRAMFPEKPAEVVNNPVLREGVREMLTKSLDKTLPALLQSRAAPPPR
ncbi:hypothetical protein JQ596_04235 [Bradyrhizobium manausense]|uniref:hypothetical protein n=1 Tax=Bradyrhizobium TaxID=374 RepID=UPI001BA83605|nr:MULTISPECIES: hypothetical protein [Bradyrhizobium]MBR0824736.1 hypothetical protein [Bradyrhizobium manausense]UVO29484.1 hypothetical protein KUF59_01540 [Bradyrhizobium arachidis]